MDVSKSNYNFITYNNVKIGVNVIVGHFKLLKKKKINAGMNRNSQDYYYYYGNNHHDVPTYFITID